MTDCSTVLVTGGYGCIGAETIKWLLQNTDARVVACSRKVDEDRTRHVFDGVRWDAGRLEIVPVDVTDREGLAKLFANHDIETVIHLAALQTPDCNANRDLGLQINLAGTQNLLELAKTQASNFRRFVFASSIAVYGPRSKYPPGRVPMLADPQPVNVYGVWKLASEHLVRIFHEETGVPTLNLRPGVLYGPGRDAGLTSTPTTALKHVVLGKRYEIPFRTRQDYLYAPDVGAAFAIAATSPYEGCGTYTLPSFTLTTEELVAKMQKASHTLGMHASFAIQVGDAEVPFICDLEYQPFLEQFPSAPHTPVDQALEKSLRTFQRQAERGWLSV